MFVKGTWCIDEVFHKKMGETRQFALPQGIVALVQADVLQAKHKQIGSICTIHFESVSIGLRYSPEFACGFFTVNSVQHFCSLLEKLLLLLLKEVQAYCIYLTRSL